MFQQISKGTRKALKQVELRISSLNTLDLGFTKSGLMWGETDDTILKAL